MLVHTNIGSAGLVGDHQWAFLLPTSLPTYIPLVAARYVELISWVDSIKQYKIGSCATGRLADKPHGFMFALWDRNDPKSNKCLPAVAPQVKKGRPNHPDKVHLWEHGL